MDEAGRGRIMKSYPSCLRSRTFVFAFRFFVFGFRIFVFAFHPPAANPHEHWLFWLLLTFYLLFTFLLQGRACGYQS